MSSTVTGTLTKTSMRALRLDCDKCGTPGPYYWVADENGSQHRVISNDATRGIAQGGTVPLQYLHTCVTGGTGTTEGGTVSTEDTSVTELDSNSTDTREAVDTSGTDTSGSKDMQAHNSSEMDALRNLLQTILGKPQIDAEQVKQIAREVIEGVVMPTRTFVQTATETREVEGTTHKDFGKVLKGIAAGLNVQLVGGPGVGKTHMCEQIAGALGLEFYAINFHLQSTASELKGYMSATGEYVPTVVFDWATNPEGGILLCDELDRAHAGILAALNSILSNRFIVLPNREVVRLTDKHVVLAATNTWGDGPDWQYPAAQKFSAEFKDRFIAMYVDIDETVELAAAMAKGAPADVTKRAVSYVQRVRKNVQREAISGVVISPRASQAMAALLAQETDWDDAVAYSLRKGMNQETWDKVA